MTQANDFYSRDTSKKIRVVKRAKGQAGEHLGEPLYGYIKDPNDKKKQRREVAQAKKRIVELDRIFKRIYKDEI